MASEATSASYPHPSTTSTSTLDGGPPSLPPVGFHVPPTSQSLPGFGELDAGFYASTSSAPYPPAIAPPAFNPGVGGGAYQQQPHPPPSQGGVGSFPYPSPGLPLPQTSGSGGTHSPFSGYPPTPFSGGPPSYSPAAPTPHHHPLTDPFSTVPLSHPHPSSSAPSISLPPLSTTATSGGNLPPIGRVRCYWVLLSPQLEFVFLDPIMQHHLGEFRDKLLGTNLLDWVHPEEREQLAGDLLPATGEGEEVKGVEAGGVFGSVTRLRYSRMTRVLRHLGCAAPPSPPDAHTYTIDSEWLNLDLTTSWIAGDRKGKGKAGGGGKGGAVLAFLHATEDKDTVSDNDSQNRTEWTNWCGPAVDYPGYLTPSQCEELVAALERVTSSSVGGGGGEKAVKVEEGGGGGGGEEGSVVPGPPPHVYQILDAQGRPIVTFPRSNGGGRGEGEKGDKVGESYDVEQFSMLAREVMARPRETIASRTSCTRRYRSKHPVMKDGTLTTIESVVVMYGAITFACFQTGGVYLRPTTTSTSSAASASSSGAPSTAGRKGRLSLITNGAQLHQHHPPTANDFALEDVPPTTPVAGTPHPNGNGVANGKRGSVGGEQNGGNSKSASMSPPSKRFKPSVPAPAPPPPSSQPPQQPLSGLSIMTGGRLFRNTLDVEAITAGGISPTVASASAILGSFSADAHQLAQQHQQQQQQQQTQQPPQRQQQFSPNVTHSPSTGQASYSAFYNAQPPPPQPPTSFSPFDPPTISYSHSHSHPTPPLYGHSAPTYSPHPLSQAHAAPGYFSPAPVSPHDQSMSGPPSYPPIPTSQPFPSTDPTAFSSSAADHTSNNLPPPPPPPSASASASTTVVPLDPSQIPVPPPPPPHSQSGKKPPKQRPDGPVFKPNVKACESCGTVNSPEWRKGPTGAKSLCNACGLRYARSVARQKKQAEAAANGGVAPKGKGKKKTGKAAAAAAAAAAEKGVKAEGSPEGSSTPSLPPHSQPSPVHTSLPGGYDLSAYARASPKPYTPYHTTAPNFPGSFAPVMPSPTTSQPSPFHSPLPPTTSSAYFPAMGYSAAPPFSGAPPPIPMATHSPLPPPPPPTYGDYSRSSSFGSSSAGATSHAPHLPGISTHHFNASVSPHPHLHSPHLEHPPPPQHSPLESPATASGGMFRSSSQGGALSQAPPQPSYQPYDWRHEQAEGAAGGGQERGEGQ